MTQSLPSDQELYYTDMSVGEILRRTRMHYGQSLEDIERALRIRSGQIEAIENGNVEQLPGRVYAIGFVRSYSEYLGLDGDKMVGLFKTQSAGKTAKPALDFPVAASESKVPPVWLVLASLIAALFIIIGLWSYQDRDRTLVTEVPEVSQSLDMAADAQAVASSAIGIAGAAQTPGEVVYDSAQNGINAQGQPEDTTSVQTVDSAVAAPPEPPEPEAAQQGILLNILQNSWVEIKDRSGRAVVSRVLQAGDQYYVPDRPDLSISLGNAGGVQLTVDGQELVPLGNRGQVRRNIPLNVEYLKKNFAKPAPAGAGTQNTLENAAE